MKNNKFDNDIAVLKEAIQKDRLVIFAGAGVSYDSGVPLWKELTEEISKNLNETVDEQDPMKLAQILYNEKGQKRYFDIIEKVLETNKGYYNPIHEIIFELNPQHIITTNFDDFFESIIYEKGLPFSTVSRDDDLPYAKHKKLNTMAI